MVKTLVQTASRLVQIHKDIGPCLVRIQTGFMKDKNLAATEQFLDELERRVRDLRTELKQPTSSSNYVPLK